jgi:hypothetical protein
MVMRLQSKLDIFCYYENSWCFFFPIFRLVNLCDDMRILIKNEPDEPWELDVCKSMFFVWPELVKSKRDLYWSVESSIGKEFHHVQVAHSGVEQFDFKFDPLCTSVDDLSTGKIELFFFLTNRKLLKYYIQFFYFQKY